MIIVAHVCSYLCLRDYLYKIKYKEQFAAIKIAQSAIRDK